MYFKNPIGIVYVIGNTIICEDRHTRKIIEIKDEKQIECFFLLEVDLLQHAHDLYYGI